MMQKLIKIQKELTELLERLLKGLQQLIEQLVESNMLQWFQQAWDKLNNYYQVIKAWEWNDFSNFFTNSFEGFINAVTGIFNELTVLVENIDWSSISGFAQDVILPLIQQIFELVGPFIGFG